MLDKDFGKRNNGKTKVFRCFNCGKEHKISNITTLQQIENLICKYTKQKKCCDKPYYWVR